MKNVFVCKGSEDGVIAVMTNAKKAERVCKLYVEQNGQKAERQTFDDGRFYQYMGEDHTYAGYEEISVNYYHGLN